jgi:hypothetical protein
MQWHHCIIAGVGAGERMKRGRDKRAVGHFSQWPVSCAVLGTGGRNEVAAREEEEDLGTFWGLVHRLMGYRTRGKES